MNHLKAILRGADPIDFKWKNKLGAKDIKRLSNNELKADFDQIHMIKYYFIRNLNLRARTPLGLEVKLCK